jgi:hypothetical protein
MYTFALLTSSAQVLLLGKHRFIHRPPLPATRRSETITARVLVPLSAMQKSFSDLEYAAKKKLTRRDRFLAEIEWVTPWGKLHKLVEPF